MQRTRTRHSEKSHSSKYYSSASATSAMVFIDPNFKCTGSNCKDFGVVTMRLTGKYLGLLLIESVVGLIVGFANFVIIIVLVLGWRKLMKNHFYVVLANLIVCTSLKAFVEFAFIVPYYVLQGSDTSNPLERPKLIIFSTQYEFIIFNVTVFADYGVLFFSVLIAINRFITVASAPEVSRTPQRNQGVKTGLSCALVWICSALIPVLFFLFQCQYAYDSKLKFYGNICAKQFDDSLIVLLNCLIYLSYACAVIVLVIYLVILLILKRQRQKLYNNRNAMSIPRAQVRLLKQCLLVFLFYATSILCVFVMSFVRSSREIPPFEISYIENLLNLSIAAVYPLCFLSTSGEMRSIISKKFTPRISSVSSIQSSSNSERNRRIELNSQATAMEKRIPEDIYNAYSITATVLSCTFNILLIYILGVTNVNHVGPYRILLMSFAIVDVMISLVHAAIIPTIHMTEFGYICWSYRFIDYATEVGVLALTCWVIFFYQTFILITFHYVYRFVVLCQPPWLDCMRTNPWRNWLTLAIVADLFFVGSILANGLIGWVPSALSRAAFAPGLQEQYGINITNPERGGYMGIVYWIPNESGDKEWQRDALALILALISIFSLCAVTIGLCLKRILEAINPTSVAMSAKTRVLQRQLFRALLWQTIVPTCTSYAPIGLIYVLPLFQYAAGGFGTLALASSQLFPLIDPFLVLFFIQGYQSALTKVVQKMISGASTHSTTVAVKDFKSARSFTN